MHGRRWAIALLCGVGVLLPDVARAEPAKAEPAKATMPAAAGLSGGIVEVPDTGKDPKKGGRIERGVRLRSKRVLVGVELTPGVAIPFKKYLDFGNDANPYNMENSAGFSMGVALTLNNLELRYAYSALSAGRVQGRLPDELVTALNQLAQLSGGQPVNQVIDIQAPSALKLHHIALGYRITFEIHEMFQLAFPLGFGIVISQPPDFGVVNYSLFGFGGYVGVRPELKLAKMLAIGLDVRFSTYITEPDANLAGAGYAATKKIFDNAVAWLPMLSIGASARVYY